MRKLALRLPGSSVGLGLIVILGVAGCWANNPGPCQPTPVGTYCRSVNLADACTATVQCQLPVGVTLRTDAPDGGPGYASDNPGGLLGCFVNLGADPVRIPLDALRDPDEPLVRGDIRANQGSASPVGLVLTFDGQAGDCTFTSPFAGAGALTFTCPLPPQANELEVSYTGTVPVADVDIFLSQQVCTGVEMACAA